MTKFKGQTHIIFVLDESGSMDGVRAATIDGFNEWLSGAKKDAGDKAHFTLMKFDTEYRPLEQNVPLADAKPLDTARYEPRGMTALYDAIAHCVQIVEPKVGKKDRALVLILTDGQENSSQEFNRERIAKIISDREAKGNWTFTYLSAALSAFSDAQAIGIAGGNTMTFHATTDGISGPKGAMGKQGALRTASTLYFSGAMASTEGFYTPDDAEPIDPKWVTQKTK